MLGVFYNMFTHSLVIIPQQVGAGNIFIFLVVLLSMLVFVIAAVHCQGWQLTKKLGGIMILLYWQLSCLVLSCV
jgi:hypothetical protein